MNFSKQTLALLKNFATINGGIVLQKGNLVMTRAPNKTVYAETTIPEEIDAELAIYDLNGFLSILSLADENAEISIKADGDISIKSAKSEINWQSADPDSIPTPKRRVQLPETQVVFELTADDYTQLMRVSRGLGADTITIASVGNKIVVNAFNKKADIELAKVLYSIEVGEMDEPKEFNYIINMANMKMLADTYTVGLWGNGDMVAAKFSTDATTYIVSVEADSTHNF